VAEDLLQIEALTKRFGGVLASDGVSLTIRKANEQVRQACRGEQESRHA
jgi:ABC-type branched-subunit amino acid transport system ATPase component